MKIAVLTLVLVLCGCKDGRDPFFRQSSEEQRAEARQLSTSKVYRLYKQSFKQPWPPLYTLSDVLGERGEEALLLWIADLETGDGLSENYEYGSLLRAIRDRSSVTICSDQRNLDRAAAALAGVRKARIENVRMHLTTYCQPRREVPSPVVPLSRNKPH